jgi:hypothetical protein
MAHAIAILLVAWAGFTLGAGLADLARLFTGGP